VAFDGRPHDENLQRSASARDVEVAYSDGMIWRVILVVVLLILVGLVFYGYIYRNLKRDGQ